MNIVHSSMMNSSHQGTTHSQQQQSQQSLRSCNNDGRHDRYPSSGHAGLSSRIGQPQCLELLSTSTLLAGNTINNLLSQATITTTITHLRDLGCYPRPLRRPSSQQVADTQYINQCFSIRPFLFVEILSIIDISQPLHRQRQGAAGADTAEELLNDEFIESYTEDRNRSAVPSKSLAKLLMSDGVHFMVGIEYHQIPGIQELLQYQESVLRASKKGAMTASVLGRAILYNSPLCVDGVLFLEESNIRLLSSVVENSSRFSANWPVNEGANEQETTQRPQTQSSQRLPPQPSMQQQQVSTQSILPTSMEQLNYRPLQPQQRFPPSFPTATTAVGSSVGYTTKTTSSYERVDQDVIMNQNNPYHFNARSFSPTDAAAPTTRDFHHSETVADFFDDNSFLSPPEQATPYSCAPTPIPTTVSPRSCCNDDSFVRNCHWGYCYLFGYLAP